jgi:hypothetical protein
VAALEFTIEVSSTRPFFEQKLEFEGEIKSQDGPKYGLSHLHVVLAVKAREKELQVAPDSMQ